MRNKLLYILILLAGYSVADSNTTASAPVAKSIAPGIITQLLVKQIVTIIN